MYYPHEFASVSAIDLLKREDTLIKRAGSLLNQGLPKDVVNDLPQQPSSLKGTLIKVSSPSIS